MKFGLCIKRKADLFKYLPEIKKSGFRHIELAIENVDEDSYIFDKVYLKNIKNTIIDNGLTLSTHNISGVNLGEKVNRIRKASVDILYDVMNSSEEMGAIWTTIHLGNAGFSNLDATKKQNRLDLVLDSVNIILEKCQNLNLKLGVENLPRCGADINKCYLGDCPKELQYILNGAKSNKIGIVFDIGHARMFSDHFSTVSNDLETIQDQILAFHFHWNNKREDTHEALNNSCGAELQGYIETVKTLSGDLPVLFENYQIEESFASLAVCKTLL